MLTATLLSTAVNASDLSDGGVEVDLRSAQAQQDKGRDDYLDSRLQNFAETKQNGRDYDSAQVEDYESPLADQMDEFAGMEQESDAGSDKEENMADLEQDSEEGVIDQDLSDKQQNGDSYNEAELEQDEVGNDGKLDSLPQQMDDGGEEEKLDSLVQQTGEGEDGGNMEQDAINQQIGNGGDENNEELEAVLQQVDDGESNRDIEATATQVVGGDEGNVNVDRGTAIAQWNNHLDGPLKIKCPAGSGLYYIRLQLL